MCNNVYGIHNSKQEINKYETTYNVSLINRKNGNVEVRLYFLNPDERENKISKS